MKNKLFLCAMALCIVLQPVVSFGSEGAGKNVSGEQQSWWSNWRPRIQKAASRATGFSALRKAWRGATKENLIRGAAGTVAVAGSTALMALPALTMGNMGMEIAKSFFESGMSSEEAVTLMGAGSILTGFVLGAMAFIEIKKVESSADKVEKVKNILRAFIDDEIAYPTSSMKIHALMKKEDFTIPEMVDTDNILIKACAELIQEISDKQTNATQGEALKEEYINKLIADRNKEIQGLTLEEQIKKMEAPGLLANISILSRLRKRLAIEKIQGKKENSWFISKQEIDDYKPSEKVEEYRQEIRDRETVHPLIGEIISKEQLEKNVSQ